MAYFLSADLVEWIATSPIPREMSTGHEDHLIAEWFLKAGWRDTLARWISDGEFIDYPRKQGKWAARYTPHTRAVHQLKGRDEFVEAARWFMDERSRHRMDTEPGLLHLNLPDEKVQNSFRGLTADTEMAGPFEGDLE